MGAIPAEKLLSPKYLALYKQLPQTAVWKYMCFCLETPRPSGHLDKIRARVIDVAKQLSLEHRTDAVGNIVIARPGGKGFESAPTIAVQCHLDMVGSKHEGFKHDFPTDPIDARVEGEWLKANGTTLGGDDGAGIAACLALLEEESPLPPLECLFTIEEETDMRGAQNLAPYPFLTAKTLINVDSEEMDSVCVGCAGGFKRTFDLPVQKEDIGDSDLVAIKLEGFTGGHSGIDIVLGGGNAVKTMVRVLHRADTKVTFRMVELFARNPPNTIPRECTAVVAVPKGQAGEFTQLVQAEAAIAQNEYQSVDPDFAIKVTTPGSHGGKAATRESTLKMMDFIDAMPHGVQRMSLNIKGSPETSVNLAVVDLRDAHMFAHIFSRSNLESHMVEEGRRYEAIARLAGAKISGDLERFPGWEPDMSSRGLGILTAAYRELFGKDPHTYTIHAGLECGIIQKIYPGMDCSSIGPTIKGAHTPEERMLVSSVDPFFTWLIESLRKL